MHTLSSEVALDIHALLAAAARHRPLFHSEADSQHAFAWEVHHQFPDAFIRLEKPISFANGVAHLDVLVQWVDAMAAIELKYKTRKFAFETYSETYSLRNHSAQDGGATTSSKISTVSKTSRRPILEPVVTRCCLRTKALIDEIPVLSTL